MKIRNLIVIALALVPVGAFAQGNAVPTIVKGKADTVGNNCRNNKWFEVEAKISGDTVEGTLLGSAFQRGPTSFSGKASEGKFAATITYANANNLKVEIIGTKSSEDSWELSTIWNGGGISNCESKGPAKVG